ncbi:MAG: toprim domain-containing protein, partial [Bacteroidales bacterium]|nr:toprim domain-containing protein [Bacteroidales bacterium]
CGTALTSEQVRLIKRYSQNVTIIYDGDSAGIKAALRGTDIFLEEGMNVRVVVLPDGKDPDDFCKENTLEQVNEYLSSNARDFVSFKAEQLLNGAQDDADERGNVINEIADTIALVPDEVKRVTFAGALAERFDIPRDVLTRRITATRRARKEKEAARPSGYDPQVPPPPGPPTDPHDPQDPGPGVEIPGARIVRLPKVKKSRLRPSEESLLDFLLNSGREPLVFPKDSPYFSAEPISVAEFIDSALAADDIIFSQEDLRRVYDSYFEFYDQGLSQDDIVRHLASSDDGETVSLIAQLTSKRYEVTVETLKASMTSESTILVQEVPKAILLYHVKLMEEELEQVRKELKGAQGEEMMKLMGKINTINQNKKKINKQLGRI